MHRRLFLTTLVAGVAAGVGLASGTAEAAPVSASQAELAGVRAALGPAPASEPSLLEMRRRGGGFRGGGRRFRGGGWGGGRRWRGGGGWRRGGWGPGWRRRRAWGPRPWGPRPWGPPRRCFYNRWGELVCRRPYWRRPIWW